MVAQTAYLEFIFGTFFLSEFGFLYNLTKEVVNFSTVHNLTYLVGY